MAKTSETELDDFQAGFLAGWFRHAGIVDTPTVEQLAAAVAGLAAFEAETTTDENDAAPETPPVVN